LVCGAAVQSIIKRELKVYGEADFERLPKISDGSR
jgi:hypothetical protein